MKTKQEALEELDKTANKFFSIATNLDVEASNRSLSTGVFAGLGIAKSVVANLDESPELDEPQKAKVPANIFELMSETKRKYPDITFYGFIKQCCAEGFGDIESPENKLVTWLAREADNESILMKVWLDEGGYEVEEEPKYYVQLPFLEWNEEAAELEQTELYLGFDITSDETRFMTNKNGYRDFKTKLDEETIKSIDERYWPFAVPVEKEVAE